MFLFSALSLSLCLSGHIATDLMGGISKNDYLSLKATLCVRV